MRSNLFLLLLLPCILCAGQSEYNSPTNVPPSSPGISASTHPGGWPASGAAVPVLSVPTAVAPAPAPVQAPAPTRVAGPLTTKSEFENFAEDATGRRLPVYGRQLFDEVPTTFSPVENVPVPADYVLGPGDQLLIRAWGKIDLDASVTVDRNGQINLPRVGTLTVAGLRYAQVEGYLHTAISTIFKNFELNVALGQLRTIQIFVLGDARQPGAYTVSSLSTLVDALFASGGPSATGTMRHIQLRRGDRTITEFDIYDLINKGDKSHDIRLLPGDVIYIPSIGPQIAISGDVNQPGIYELKGETTVGAALKYAGGITSLADAERAVLERIESHSSREVQEFALDVQGQARMLKDGDLLRVFPLSPKFANALTLRGNVAQPGLYPWKEGMRVSDLIPSRAFLITRDYWNKQNHLVRPRSDHPFASPTTDIFGNSLTDALVTQRTDALGNLRTDTVGNSRTDALGNPSANALAIQHADALGSPRTDAVGNSRTDTLDSQRTDALGNPRTDRAGDTGSRTVDSIGKNSAEINWEYALIERLDERDLSTRLIPFNLGNVINNPASADNRILKPGDVVTIFSRADLELPMDKHASFVRIGGEVNAPGVYRVKPGETLRELVERAGGLTEHSYLFASQLTRATAKQVQQEQLALSISRLKKELYAQYANTRPNPLSNSSGAASGSVLEDQAQFGMQQSLISQLSTVQPTGRVVLDIKPDAKTVQDIPDFPLEDGDSFLIPPMLGTIQVVGEVYNENAFRYQIKKRLGAYLNDAGGATRQADVKRIFLMRADGTVVSRQTHDNHWSGNFEKIQLMPGDAIVVPPKLKTPGGFLESFPAITQILSQTALTGAMVSLAM